LASRGAARRVALTPLRPRALLALQVAVLGAAGGIGQPLSLLLKMNPLVSQLSLYDIANTPGVAADLSHCNTPAQARGPLRAAATGAHTPQQLLPSPETLQLPPCFWPSAAHGWRSIRAGPGLRRPRPAGGCADGRRSGHHPRRRAAQAGHDP
jgi:hypothetical protein